MGDRAAITASTGPRWEHFAHEADIGIRGIGPSKEQSFEQAGLALTSVFAGPASIKLEQRVNITCEAPNDEMLLINWINTLLYEMATQRMLFGRFEVFISKNRLSALAWGQQIDVSRNLSAVKVKEATCVVKENGHKHWIAQCAVKV